MKLKKSHIICMLALCVALALSVTSLGFAAWQTTITGSGSVSAAGKWDVAVTGAGLNLSTGTSASTEITTYELQRTGVKDDTLIAATLTSTPTGSTPRVDDASLAGTQSDQPMSPYLNYCAVDTTKYDLSKLTTLTSAERTAMVADETTVTLSDHLNAYYRYVNGDTTSGTAEGAAASAAKVVDGLLRDSTALLKQLFPDSWQNYTLCYLSVYAKSNHTIAAMTEKVETIVPDGDGLVSWTDDSVSFANVTFGLPGAWAEYTVTVTNNGTVDANLSNAVIELDTDSDQLVLDKPDLSGEVLKPGESCTITCVVKVPAELTEDLDAAGTLIITLPYSQATVEEAPQAGHSHS